MTTTPWEGREGRRIKTTDPRTGSTIINYNENHRIDFIKDPKENKTEFAYYSETGRKKYEKNPLNHFKRYKYNLKGQITAVWGDGTCPVKYTYDDLGRMKTMITYRTDNLLNDDSFPDNLTGDTTTWHYDEKGNRVKSGSGICYLLFIHIFHLKK